MIRGNDFILNPDKLQEEFQLVEVSDWVDFSTKEKLGFYYTVLLPKLKFEKVKVGIKANTAIVTNEELEQKGQIPVSFDGLHTWAFCQSRSFQYQKSGNEIISLLCQPVSAGQRHRC